VATALPTIVGDLHGLNHLSWVVTAYLLTTTLSTPLYGKISDLYGRKKIFQVAIVIFLIGSALSGLARNMDQLIAFRAVQGLGGGGLMALAMAIIGDIVSPRERGRYQGYFGGVFAFASIGGPLAGGFFVDHLTWRWIFYINIPVGILALVITSVVLRLPLPRRPRTIDYTGSAILVGAVTSLLLVTLWGGQTYAWGSGVILGPDRLRCHGRRRLRLVGATGHRADLPSPSLRQPHTGCGLRHHPAGGGGDVRRHHLHPHLPPTRRRRLAGVVRGPAPAAHGWHVGDVHRIGSARVPDRAVQGVPGGGHGPHDVRDVVPLPSRAPHVAPEGGLYMVVFGLGMGMVMQILVLAVQNSVARDDIGAATSAISFFRNIGAAFGTALFGTILTVRLGHWLPLLVHERTHFSLSSSFTITPTS
jgi:MFS family permease